jgi:DNA-directed RNA polymerase specialized sigma24 family protein
MAGAVSRRWDHADVVEAEQPRLLSLAYRMLGSVADVEDIVQDA